MRQLHLDYRRSPPASLPKGTGWVFAAALLLMTVSGYAGWLQRQLSRVNDVRMQTSTRSPAPDLRKVALQRKEASEAAKRLGLAWDALFGAIEAATRDSDVSLLSIRPDASQGAVRLTAETRELDLALDYAKALAVGETLTDVHLAQHETVNEPQRAIRFSLVATWKPGI